MTAGHGAQPAVAEEDSGGFTLGRFELPIVIVAGLLAVGAAHVADLMIFDRRVHPEQQGAIQ